ncbi:hypothetical protein NCCP2222_38600 [Sporosarcina sp. NCCP-2222]|nr:hypothetical protein NCCP2222_38600 [Sporosarcina sp. NCCP-2222]
MVLLYFCGVRMCGARAVLGTCLCAGARVVCAVGPVYARVWRRCAWLAPVYARLAPVIRGYGVLYARVAPVYAYARVRVSYARLALRR